MGRIREGEARVKGTLLPAALVMKAAARAAVGPFRDGVASGKVRLLPAVLVLALSIAAAVAVWPTSYRLGWAASLLGREIPPAAEEPAAIGRYVFELASVWWGRVNAHPPQSAWDWIAVVGLSAFAGAALVAVIAKAVVFALMTAAALGAACGAVVTRFGGSLVAWELFRLRVEPLMRRAVRFWSAEFFLVMAGIVALDAVALALRVST
jgi:hypothetical protein